MFNDVSYWKEEVPGTGICKPANTFSSMFNANSSDGQLEIEIAALANAFSETVLSESDVFLTLGDFFWSIGSGRCAFAAYKRAKKLAPLPDGVAARLQALQKKPAPQQNVCYYGRLVPNGTGGSTFRDSQAWRSNVGQSRKHDELSCFGKSGMV